MIANKHSIIRLSKYKSALIRFRVLGFKRVFSENIADAAGVTAAQVRKDFSIFGILGNRRGGYPLDDLVTKLNSILGKDEVQRVIIAGAGNMGSALLNYKGFDKEGIQIVASFDVDVEKINREAAIPILPVEEMPEFIRKENIKIGIIAVTGVFAQQVLDEMVEAGIKGVLNFAPVRLRAADDIFINNVDLLVELEKVIYYVRSTSDQPVTKSADDKETEESETEEEV